MRDFSRKVFDYAFSAMGIASVGFMVLALLVVLLPIFYKGSKAFIFEGTVEHRKLHYEKFSHGDEQLINAEKELVFPYRKAAWDLMDAFESEMKAMPYSKRSKLKREYRDVKEIYHELVGPRPDESRSPLVRLQYGQNRWDRAQVKLHELLYEEEWVYEDGSSHLTFIARSERFEGTQLVEFFEYVEQNVEAMLRPEWTFYWRFLTDDSIDASMYGGIWPELLGTIYLTIGALIVAMPFGLITAIYLTEYAKDGLIVRGIRSCISTLAGVPSIIFGLIGMAFFINTLHVSDSKSVLAGALTLGLLILPTIIRTSEEAIKAVPRSYKEASHALGAGRWTTIVKVVLPAAMPGIITGLILSMGRAAGETAPIIFTAAVSVGSVLTPLETLSEPTRALSWNIYNLCTEHEAVEEIRHVQYGMVVVLIGLVIGLSLIAILLRARIQRKMKG